MGILDMVPFLNGNRRKRTIKPIELWDIIASSYWEKGISSSGLIRRSQFYMDMKGFYSDVDNVTYMYIIDNYPQELPISFRTLLRRECKEGVRISFVSLFNKFDIQWNSAQLKSRLRTWKSLDEDTVGVDAYTLYENLSLLDNQKRRRDSLTYLSDADIRRRRRTFRIYSAMYISGKRGQNFDDTNKEVVALCRKMGIDITRVMGDIQNYVQIFSPFTANFDASKLSNIGSNVLTDELLARFNTYSQGIVGVKGLYWGTDIFSSFPCLKPAKTSDDSAENWLITSETGGGKSFFVKVLVLQLLAMPEVNGTIMDIEGFEYINMAFFLANCEEVVVINMAEGQGRYFDPVEIILSGDPKLDKDMYSLSVSFTLSMFKTLAGDTIENPWVEIIINDAVAGTYAEAGVVEDDMSTWSNSKGLTLFSVYDSLGEMSGNEINDEYKLALDLLISKLSRYFDPMGSRRGTFKERISVSGINTAKLVVCSFGMAGKSSNTVDSVQMALMQLCAAHISHLRSIFSKQAGKFNFKLWEEFQRWGKFPGSEITIGTALSGGRKLGDINIIITNVVRELLDEDRFQIFDNITSIAVGCIWDSDVRTRLCERLSIDQMIPELDTLVKENVDLSSYSEGDTIMDNPYSKAFLIGLDKTVFTISKMSLPTDLARSELFKTGVNIKGTKNEEEESDMYEQV